MLQSARSSKCLLPAEVGAQGEARLNFVMQLATEPKQHLRVRAGHDLDTSIEQYPDVTEGIGVAHDFQTEAESLGDLFLPEQTISP